MSKFQQTEKLEELENVTVNRSRRSQSLSINGKTDSVEAVAMQIALNSQSCIDQVNHEFKRLYLSLSRTEREDFGKKLLIFAGLISRDIN